MGSNEKSFYGFRNDLKLKKEFDFPHPVILDKKLQDFLIDNVSGKYYLPKKGVDFVTDEKNLNKRYTQIDGEVSLCQKKNQQFNWHGDFVFVEENKDMEKRFERYLSNVESIKGEILNFKIERYMKDEKNRVYIYKFQILGANERNSINKYFIFVSIKVKR